MITKLFGLCILVGCLGVVYQFETAGAATGWLKVFHWPAIVLTGCGPLGIVFMCSNGSIIFQTLGILFGAAPEKNQKKYDKETILLRKLGDSFYQAGFKAFDDVKLGRKTTPFVKKVIDRLSVRMPVPDIRLLLESEQIRKHSRITRSLNVINLGVKLAPSVGMLGTILGMVQLLSTLSDPAQLGPKISLALFTTFYGLFFSLAMWTPLQQKIERYLEVEIEAYEKVIHWLGFLEKRKPGDYFADTAELPMTADSGQKAA